MTKQLGEFDILPDSDGRIDHKGGSKGGHTRNGMIDLGIDLAQQGLGDVGCGKSGGIEGPDQQTGS